MASLKFADLENRSTVLAIVRLVVLANESLDDITCKAKLLLTEPMNVNSDVVLLTDSTGKCGWTVVSPRSKSSLPACPPWRLSSMLAGTYRSCVSYCDHCSSPTNHLRPLKSSAVVVSTLAD